MKRPQPDIGDILKSDFINNLGSTRKFTRLWGTTYIGGVEVLNHRRYYYPRSARPANFEKLFRYLGAYEDLNNNDPKGVQSAWFYLNKNKGSGLPVAEGGTLEDSYHLFVSYNLDQLWWDEADGAMPENLTLTTSIVIEALIDGSRTDTVSTTPLLDPSWPTEQLITAIQNNYETLWDTCLISQQGVGVINKGTFTSSVANVELPDEDDLSPDDPWLAALSRYALRNNDVVCTIKDVQIGYAKSSTGRRYATYVVDIEIPHMSFDTSSAVVNQIALDLGKTYTSRTRTRLSYPNGYWTKQEITAMDISDLQDDPDIVTRPYLLWENEAEEDDSRYSNIWLNSGGTYYLKADAVRNPRNYGLTYKGLFSYLVSLIDSGYKKKKVKWWKKALAVVTFVVLVIVNPFGAATVWGAILAAATVLTLLTLAFALAGMDDWAAAFAEANKMIEPLVIIATIIMLTQSLQKMAQKAAEKAAEEGIKETIKEFVADYIDDFVQEIVKGATDVFAGNLTASSLSFLTKAVKLLTLPQQIKLEELKEKNKDLKAEYEQLTQELSREYDALKGFMYIYARPATADWSIYAQEFDQPYERGGGPLAMGNIQRTTKQALRKASYNEPAFENILVV
jgi:hypothetical protein